MTAPTTTTAPGRSLASWFHRWPMLLWMTALWVLLWGDLTLANVLAGVAIAAILLIVAPMPAVGYAGRPSFFGLVHLVGRFIFDVLHASVQVSWLALHPRKAPQGGVVRIRLRSASDLILTLTGVFTSLVPGSIIVEAHRLTGTLYVHVLDLGMTDGADGMRKMVLAQERRLLYALANQEDLAKAGLPRRRWWGGGRGEVDQ
ncbi:Na+/H+ antiporter subunit E [Pseudactinotalea sp. Z1748]|uniref:Na+/H+ antiporter subunit E n=1 Tax=Pseudactinotalea sp. Z1748 TaxID=3413027 RepID=UPI003C7BD40C